MKIEVQLAATEIGTRATVIPLRPTIFRRREVFICTGAHPLLDPEWHNAVTGRRASNEMEVQLNLAAQAAAREAA